MKLPNIGGLFKGAAGAISEVAEGYRPCCLQGSGKGAIRQYWWQAPNDGNAIPVNLGRVGTIHSFTGYSLRSQDLGH